MHGFLDKSGISAKFSNCIGQFCTIVVQYTCISHFARHSLPLLNIVPWYNDISIMHKINVELSCCSSSFQEAEGQLEHEEQRVLRAQLELTQLKQELERRMNEKDEEVESQRKNHQRQLDALKQSLEEETRLKNEQVKQKKLVEGQVDELQGALDDQERVILELSYSKRYIHL